MGTAAMQELGQHAQVRLRRTREQREVYADFGVTFFGVLARGKTFPRGGEQRTVDTPKGVGTGDGIVAPVELEAHDLDRRDTQRHTADCQVMAG